MLKDLFQNQKRFIFFLLGWGIYFALIFGRALRTDGDGNIVAYPLNLWGDWCAHFTMGSAMAYRKLILTTSPFLITAPFHYPYLVNTLSALLIRMGFPFFASFVIPSFIFSICLVGLLYLFYRQTFESDRIALTASLIFLLNGGLGFFQIVADAFHSNRFFHTLFFPPHLATKNPEHLIVWYSVIDSMIIPQRAFELGFPMALVALMCLNPLNKNFSLSWPKIIMSGLLIGLLPIAHTHSFAAVLLILPFWWGSSIWKSPDSFSLTNILKWAALFILIGSFAGVIWFTVFSVGTTAASAFRFNPGWYVSKGFFSWIYFWIKNWGVTPAVALVGLWLWLRTRRGEVKGKIILFILPFGVLFLMLNLFTFQPWAWDNTKFLAWVAVGVSGLAGYAVSHALHLWDRKWRPASIAIFILMILSGGVDAYRILIPSLNSAELFNHDEIESAAWARTHTDPNSIWLTYNNHNNWVFNLTGRQGLLAYEGWLWSHGYNYTEVKNDLATMYKNPRGEDLFKKYNVSYIVVGPQEIENLKADRMLFEVLFKKVYENKSISVFIYKPPKDYSNVS